MSSSYSEMFKDPRWQKCRLEIMNRDNFQCQSCGTKDQTLNVHHSYYEKGKKPWEYDADVLITLCEKCHKERHEMKKDIEKAISRLSQDELSILHGFATSGTEDDGDAFANILGELEISRATIGITKAMSLLNEVSFFYMDGYNAAAHNKDGAK